jgi:hypothetical protein
MASTEYPPTAPARIGTMTRNPLPKIEDSGVIVAFTRDVDFWLLIKIPADILVIRRDLQLISQKPYHELCPI